MCRPSYAYSSVIRIATIKTLQTASGSSSSVLAQAASISSSYFVLGGGGVRGLEKDGSRQEEVFVLIFGIPGTTVVGDARRGSRRRDTGTTGVERKASTEPSRVSGFFRPATRLLDRGSARRNAAIASSPFVFFSDTFPGAVPLNTPGSGPISPRRSSLDLAASATSLSTFPRASISRRACVAGWPTCASLVQRSKAGAMTCG
mmetsp:Transcript_4541/g.18159  ORF Transcript_4541/g.18159 Transcript_4541/m.18159 type:complete len:203 (-) Transcript_4541:649-1257(-)